MRISLGRFISSLATIFVVGSTLTLVGCAVDVNQTALAGGTEAPGISGVLHGGPNPVIGATVKLYATTTVAAPTSSNNYGYGQAGSLLGTTTTDSNGSFTFASPAACPSGQQAYITSAAGNTGANAINANSLLMAAIGPCSNLSSSTSIWIDEPSTVAAAYALGNFMAISGTGSSMVVGISAPANNNAVTGSCTVTSGVTTSCAAAGLAHAFLNAANLVHASNSSGLDSTPATGTVYSSPPSNSTSSLSSSTQPALLNQVPVQEINSLANSVQACVNSIGGTSGDSSTCGFLFLNTTVSSTYTSNTVYTTAPTNTLQALVNLAKFPFMTSTGVTNIFNIAPASNYYLPTLTTAPPDWSIAIIWRSLSNGTLPLGEVYMNTTDSNDNVYAVSETAPATGSSTGALPLYVQSISSNGVGNWSTAAQIVGSAGSANALCSTGSTAVNSAPCGAATDTAGNLWVTNGNGSYTVGGIYQVKESNGAVTQFANPTVGYPITVAVDAHNDVFFTTTNVSGSGTADFWQFPSGSTSTTAPSPIVANGTNMNEGHASGSLVFDAAGDLFGAEDSGSNVGYSYVANTGTLSAEAFGSSAVNCNCLGGTADSSPTGSMVDPSGNFWFGTATTLIKIVAANIPTITGGGSTGVGVRTITGASQMRIPRMDGAGTIFVPDTGTTTPVMFLYYTGLAAQASIAGCNVGTATGSATCITSNFGAPNGGLLYKAVNASPDSTGSLWVSSYGNDGLIQILGPASPTWPQTSYLHPAQLPQ